MADIHTSTLQQESTKYHPEVFNDETIQQQSPLERTERDHQAGGEAGIQRRQHPHDINDEQDQGEINHRHAHIDNSASPDYSSHSEDQFCSICYEVFNESDRERIQTPCGHVNTCLQCVSETILYQLSKKELRHSAVFERYPQRVTITIEPISCRPSVSTHSKTYSYKCPWKCEKSFEFTVHYHVGEAPHIVIELTPPNFVLSDLDSFIDTI